MSPFLTPIDPEALGGRGRGYANGILAPAGGRLLFVAGQVGWDLEHRFASDRFAEQFDRALGNVLVVVAAAGGAPEHVARLTIYVRDAGEYIAAAREVGESYRRRMGSHYPAMSLVEVAALLETGARVEIEATAVLPAETKSP